MKLLGLEIRRAGSPVEPSAELRVVLDGLYDLQRRLKALEDDQAARELRLGELADKIRRHFARVQELDRRARRREVGDDDVDDVPDDELDRLVEQARKPRGF